MTVIANPAINVTDHKIREIARLACSDKDLSRTDSFELLEMIETKLVLLMKRCDKYKELNKRLREDLEYCEEEINELYEQIDLEENRP